MSLANAPSTPEPTKSPNSGAPKPRKYERPLLVPVGNLHNLLGKSGARPDATYRRPNSGRP